MGVSQNAFPYQPLSVPSGEKFETRLIYLHPGGFNDCIYCTIYHANIFERQPQTEYIALSYIWGDPEHTRPIQLGYEQLSTNETAHTRLSAPSPGADGYESFEVTTNLDKALRHLRDPVSKRILWVDAICINQSDEEEILSQIPWMGDVYKKAVEVRIWLGSITDVCMSTLDMQEELEGYRSGQVLIPRGSYSLVSLDEDAGAVLGSERKIIEMALLATKDYVMDQDHLLGQGTNDNSFPNELQALGVRIIAMQPWWRRVWVIQEATLATEDPVMQCSYIQFRYLRFLKLAKHYFFQNPPFTLSRTHISLNVHWMSHKGYDPSQTSQASRMLTYLSCMSGNFGVSKPKDRINALDGFLHMYGRHDEIMWLMTRNQSKQTDSEFFHRTAIWILCDPKPQSHALRILENGPSSIEGLPSWVPMWTSKRWSGENKTHGAPESKYDILAQGISAGKIYHQSSTGSRVECTSRDWKKLGMPKTLFDIDIKCTELKIYNALMLGHVIATIGVPSVQGKEDKDILRTAILEVEERILAALKSMDIPHADMKPHIQRFRDYLRTNFWDVDDTGKDSSSSSEHSSSSSSSATLEEFLECERKSSKRKSQRRGRHRVSTHRIDLNVPSYSSIAKLSNFFEHVCDLVVGSRIVGHMFEDSLPSWRRGDKLYLIPECRWILGLRRSGNRYRYMYRIFVSDLEWEQRKELFDNKGDYEDIVLV